MSAGARVGFLTFVGLLAFALNSLLCRFALAHGAMDPSSFVLIRLAAGAVALALLVRGRVALGGRWVSSLALFGYAAAFSFAYVSLSTGTGALLLFCAVQVSMIGFGLVRGERLRVLQWAGLVVALGGLAWLVAPGVAAPSVSGALLMMLAGVCWGVYSLIGRSSADPLGDTAGNFLRSLVWVLCLAFVFRGSWSVTGAGVCAAVLSGAVTSGVGYFVWYAALRSLAASTASALQLCVPVIAAVAGVVLLGEDVSARLVLASVGILGGILLVVRG